MHWYEKQPERLALEGSLLRQHFPEARLVKKDQRIRVWLKVAGQSATYRCELVYPARFPWDEIHAFIHSPSLQPGPHQFTGGRLCLHHSEDVGPQTTAIVYIAWLKGWIARYEEFRRTGTWRD